MKKFIVPAFCALLAACTSTNEYKIEGNVSEDLDGKTIYLEILQPDMQFVTVDSTIVEKGKYTFKGVAEKPELAAISVQGADQRAGKTSLFIEKGKIQISTVDNKIEIKGSPLNDKMALYEKGRASYEAVLDSIYGVYVTGMQNKTMNPETEKELIAANDSVYALLTDYTKSFVIENSNSPAGSVILYQAINEFSGEELETILNSATPEFKAMPFYADIEKTLESIKRTEIGAKYTDVAMEDPEGKTISLSEYVGKDKIVLIDFWATWCGPCRKEMPVVIEAYKKYASKGFEVVGISLDTDKQAWINGIKEMNITWPQMSDLKGWKSSAVEVYGVRGIPATFLIDKDGVIIAKDLRGEQLEEALAKYLN